MAGNGGSATDSQHFVAELLGRYKKIESHMVQSHYHQT